MFEEKLRSILKIQEKRLQNGLKNGLKIFTKVYNFKGFSLVELMISLIVISLIPAAFVPVFSNKLTTGSIFAGGSGGGFNKSCSEIDEDCDLCAGSICLSCKKTCPAGETLNTTSCSCEPKVPYSMAVDGLYVTRFNMGDSSKTKIPAEAGVTVLNYTSTCGSSDDYSTKCCWTGATSGTSCSNANGDYSGCNRTVCNWAAANAICANYKQDGRTWRLATTDEMKNWTNYSIGKGNDGLMLCDGGDGYSSAFCGTGTCKGARYEDCHPDSVWTNSNVSGPNSSYRKYLGLGNWQSIEDYRTRAFSVRCVSDIVSNCETFDSDGETCTACTSGYYVSGKECKKSTEVQNCETYSKTENKCETCKDGYNLNGNKCEVDTYYKLVYGLYVTKYNMGDHESTQIPASASNVTVVDTGTTCSDGYCCWKGATSGSECDDSNGSYSGCNRTVCTRDAAYQICKNYKQDGRTWRLPTSDEMRNWATYSIGLKNNGLMFCDSVKKLDSAYCLPTSVCSGANNNKCNANQLWSSSYDLERLESGTFRKDYITVYSYWYMSLANGGFTFTTYDDTYEKLSKKYKITSYGDRIGLSVRCVSDTVKNCATYGINNACTFCKTKYYLKNGKCNPVTEQEGCTAYSPTENECTICSEEYQIKNGKCIFTSTGKYFLQIGNLCVMKRNVGDFEIETINFYDDNCYGLSRGYASELDSVRSACGSSSNYSTKCFWDGITSANNEGTSGSYYTFDRKVYNWAAANAICPQIKTGGKTWRLPTTSEMSNWATYSKGKGDDGLLLCDYHSGYSSSYCDTSAYCYGANNNYCRSYRVWSGNTINSSIAFAYELSEDNWNKIFVSRTGAYSVRCVAPM